MAKQVFCLWGDSSTGKTALLATAARGYNKATGRKIRLVSAESAQSQSQFGGLIADGIVQPWWLDARSDAPFERIWQAVLGYWPIDISEPLSPVVPAFTYQFLAKCEKDQTVAYQSGQPPKNAGALTCPKCKEPLIVRMLRQPNPKNGIAEVGMYLFEGLTEFSAMMMRNMSERVAKGEAGEKHGGEVAVRFQDGQLWIGGNTQGQYGTAQNQIKNRVDESKHLFGVDYVGWTAVRAEDKDASNKRVGRVFGPKVAGQAATSDIPRWFGPTLGTALVPGASDKAPEFRLYLSTYFQTWDALDAKVPNLCNNRIPPAQLRKNGSAIVTRMPLKVEDPVPDYLVVDPNDDVILWKVLEMIEQRQQAAGGKK